MRFFGFILSVLLFCSCSDFSKGEQLETIAQLNKTIDSIQTVLIEQNIDEITEIELDAETVIDRIKDNIDEDKDTLELKMATKIDKYMSMYHSIQNLSDVYTNLRKQTKIEKSALKKLNTDIENSDGNRKKYGEYVLFEVKNVKQLTTTLKEYIKKRKSAIQIYDNYNDIIYDFSFELITK